MQFVAASRAASVATISVTASQNGVNPGLLGAALVVGGANLVNENDGPDSAVRLLEGLIETLETPPKPPTLRIVGEGSGAAGDGRGDV